MHPSHDDDDSEPDCAQEVRSWVFKVPIGLGLCPWAGTSSKRGLLRIATCIGDTPAEVAQVIEAEIQRLLSNNSDETPRPSLSTTLLVCPHVKTWTEFQPFDDFVRSISSNINNNNWTLPMETIEQVTLVVFHPKFVRWYALPDGIGIGCIVQSHWGFFGKKSVDTAPATIIETNNKAFGLRKVKVRFHDDINQEQFVPVDWIDFSNNMNCASASSSSTSTQLPDNIMHQSPYPTIHIIVNQDLASLCIRDVSRVKRLNSKRMANLGWEGLERVLAER